jgi:hypothetical protein
MRDEAAPAASLVHIGSTDGDALTSTRSAAAVPTRKFASFAEAPPENAVIVAVPL